MGAVSKGGSSDVIVDGYPLEYYIDYIYCDRCGSFNIAATMMLKNWAALTLVLLGAGIAIYYFVRTAIERRPDFGVYFAMFWAVFVMLPILIFMVVSSRSGHRCRKCGNTHITNQDVLNYAEQDLDSLLDVPEKMVHTHK